MLAASRFATHGARSRALPRAGLAAAAAAVATCASRSSMCEDKTPAGRGCPFGAPAATGTDRRTAALEAGERPSKSRELVEGIDFAVFRRPPGTSPCIEHAGEASAHATEGSLAELLDFVCEGDSAPSVVLLGEVHDDSVAHGLQLQVLQRCAAACRKRCRRLVLSLEMFEVDVQHVLDEYVLRKAIREEDLLQDARPWGNYRQDYRPLVEFCREHGIRVVAANAPRRYVSLVSRKGTGALQDVLATAGNTSALPQLPLPPPSPAYVQKFVETIASQMPAPPQGSSGDAGCPFIGFRSQDVRKVKPEMMAAQQLWDHAMAKSVAGAIAGDEAEELPPLVLHVCGAFHCAHGLGIPEALPLYLQQRQQLEADASRAWLPMDDMLRIPPSSGGGAASTAEDIVGPKPSPPGVISVVCWPACVQQTLKLVRGGRAPGALANMGDWVVITEETWAEQGQC